MSIHVNFTDDEANSEARSFEALPTGQYNVFVDDVETKQVSKKGDNLGKDFWSLKLKVIDGPHQGRILYDTCMLFDGALYTLAQIMKGMGRTPGVDAVPSGSELIGQKFTVEALKVKDEYQMNKQKVPPGGELIYKTEVKGYRPLGGNSGTVTSNAPGASVSKQAPSGAPLP